MSTPKMSPEQIADALRGAMGVFCAISAACWLQFVWAGRR